MSTKSATADFISLPKGGGALSSLGEKFSPDLFTGTGNFSVPLAIPPGRNGLQPRLNLVYSTGNGNGPFGLGWNLGVPGISRKTSTGVPRYNEDATPAYLDRHHERRDVFLLSGTEDLVPVETIGSTVRYRPRTEGLFAHILFHRGGNDRYWEVRSTDGLTSFYGTPASFGADSATIADPSNPRKIFAWKLARTEDPFGNRIEYDYERDTGVDGPHHWDQLDLARIRYVDFGDDRDHPQFLVQVEFVYEWRQSDPFSERRSGFEIRTRKRCKRIVVRTSGDVDQVVRTYELIYLDSRADQASQFPLNGVSLLSQIVVTGFDGEETESMPPLEFGYTQFEPEERDFVALHGSDLPAQSLANPDSELVDLFGTGLPDFVEMNGTARYWRNLGEGRFERPQSMRDAPGGLALSDQGVQFIDANGDGRTDLLVTDTALSGYFPLRHDGQWDRRSFRRYGQAPSFSLKDPEVKLVDLDGDGVTDAIRSGSRMECFFNDPVAGWTHTRAVERKPIDVFPNVTFSDPRVKWADLAGDGIPTIALVHDGNVEYWPNLGHGRWGKRIHMKNSPRFPYGHDPRRILVGDVDGDGLADLVYVADTEVTLWINQSGNGWSRPIAVSGTPPVSDVDAIRLVDLMGSGISGVLWSRDAASLSHNQMFYLDFTGGLKPYLLNEMDKHLGAVTRVEYLPSTHFYLKDQMDRANRWRTSLPFPVQVVARVEVIDHFSKGKLTTQYFYHHGHWDGAEREFRGFGLVEQVDSESFAAYDSIGLHGAGADFARVDQRFFSPPTLTKTWFHQGPIGDEFGDWADDLDWSDYYWEVDPQFLKPSQSAEQFLRGWPATPNGRRIRRDALRALRGSVLRTELYALDNSARSGRPYSVSEACFGLVEVDPPTVAEAERRRIFYPHALCKRTTQWERGSDPMTQCSFTDYTDEAGRFDPFGRPLTSIQIACPRGWRQPDDSPDEAYLATLTRTVYAEPGLVGTARYIHDRVAKQTSYEILHTLGKQIGELAATRESDQSLRLTGQSRSFYDGKAFVGLELGQVGEFGALTRTESLVLNEDILHQACGQTIPPYLDPTGVPTWTADYPLEFRTLVPQRAGYTFHAGSGAPADPRGYFVNTDRRRYDFQSHPSRIGRGLVQEIHDPLHDGTVDPSAHRTLITYDTFELLPTTVTDAAGLTTQAIYDYRVLRPNEVIEPNGGTRRSTFSPLGLLASSSVQGQSASEGDQNRPCVRLEYGFRAFEDSPPEQRQPIYIRTIQQVHHDTDLDIPLPDRDATITTVEYSDGFGRLLQTRTQGEEVRFGEAHFGGGEAILPAKQSDGNGGDVIGRVDADEQRPNVVVSGWQVYDNKGRVVEKYEPFFAEGWEYGEPEDADSGQKALISFDPRGHAIRTVNADGSESATIFGVPSSIAALDLTQPDLFEPTPWEAFTYDANDNAGRTHPSASSTYRHHWNTPVSVLIDPLGRVVEVVERNREAPASPGDPLAPIREVRTRTTYDIRGNILTVTDALGRPTFRHVYDFANNNLRVDSIDAGTRTTVLDAAGGVVERRDSKGALSLSSYDRLHRPLRLWARDSPEKGITLRERREYGDAGSPTQSAGDRASNRTAYRLGRLSRQFDEAGLLTVEAYDFKGNRLEQTRKVVSDSAILSAFDGPPPDWNVDPFQVDWTTPETTPLDPVGFASSFEYDAINRIKFMTYPEDVEHGRRRLKPSYNRAGLLERVALERPNFGGGTVDDVFVERIAYNAKGQRVLMVYGNGTMTRHAYDLRTFRLRRLRTERYSRPAELTYHHAGGPLQDLVYDHDLVSNLVTIQDRTPGSGIRNTAQGVDLLNRSFAYDALYRLCSATGRECDRALNSPWHDAPRCTDLTRTRSYTELYRYDLLGNLEQLKHQANADGFTRTFDLTPGTNRLHTLTVGRMDPAVAVFNYSHDANGNMTQETMSRHFEWDYADRMRAYRTQAIGSEPSVFAHYLYDGGGQRVKKLVRKQGGRFEVTIYIDGVFEYHRVVHGGTEVANNTLHVMDDQTRIALVRVGSPFTDDVTPAVKYHLGDHLGSSNVVVDGSGNHINREEYTPYGESSFGGFARKRYRFTAKECDDASQLYYFGARFYAPWLTRWISPDPAGPKDGLNLYIYVRANPLRWTDESGTETGPTPLEEAAQTSSETLHAAAGPPPPPGHAPNEAQLGAGVICGTRSAVASANIPTDIAGKPLSGRFHTWSGAGKAEARVAIAAAGSGWMMDQTPEHASAKAVFANELRGAAEKRYPGQNFSDGELFTLADKKLLRIDDARVGAIWDPPSAEVTTKQVLTNGAVEVHQPGPGSVQERVEIPTVRRVGGLVGGLSVASGGLQLVGAYYEENPYLKGLGFASGGAEVGGGVMFLGGSYFIAQGATATSVMAAGGVLITAGTYGGLAVTGAVSVRTSLEASRVMNETISQGEQNGTYPSWLRAVFAAGRIGMAFSGM